uniref:Uncharacterized protein n=1 Tax=Pseudo-nitzschia delicatissima TaxID=44447 RepID=A0A7S0XJI4_9STRA|mmetsp:Transcript_1009/g.2340  ORF Transcript_1009/g.2340 Transcript_1009/m.2340 type:complete len:310 (+) Transcript_1009:205-1134(+)|eukprot:CAMPEP_0116093222 /NCGR_PEP_ID=MMETSP0327-20121206/8479_1 /TAXON_ID=44447 /ORGANISM="Pseudo-nitzschia delicatissima, Strain B596" /LENGTH=309 /DNA_ID=CAMNT_0003584737 /DNA_START=178 /DNA_END=1107 /DNA_ORIENTATION=+
MDTSSDFDDDAPSMNDSQSTSYQHQILYVVQKCWHSGPKQHVPVDMLRLFHSQREAEQGAYHSALAFHKVHSKPNSSASVKTLLLPSYPAHNPQGSSYGFLACGALFWVRALRMTIVAASSGVCHSAAYAILTEGVIGGTGNRNSRRGTETCDGRVFGGDATARAMAMEAVTRVRSNLTNPSLRVEAQTLPVGKPAEWLSSGAFGGDWPVQAELQYNGVIAANSIPFGTTPKRQIGFGQGNGWGRSVSGEDFGSSSSDSTAIAEPGSLIGSSYNNSSENLLVVDCPFEEPIAKRRRVVSVADDYAMMMQ